MLLVQFLLLWNKSINKKLPKFSPNTEFNKIYNPRKNVYHFISIFQKFFDTTHKIPLKPSSKMTRRKFKRLIASRLAIKIAKPPPRSDEMQFLTHFFSPPLPTNLLVLDHRPEGDRFAQAWFILRRRSIRPYYRSSSLKVTDRRESPLLANPWFTEEGHDFSFDASQSRTF